MALVDGEAVAGKLSDTCEAEQKGQKEAHFTSPANRLIETIPNPQQSWGESCTQVAMNEVP